MGEAAVATLAPRTSAAAGVLRAAAVLWFVVVLIGQWAFFYYIAAFYGASVITGDLEIWNRLQALGRTPYVAGDTAGNIAYAAHALGAGIIAFGGALQLIPQVRTYAPAFHRWNGRLFLLTAAGLSFSGFYLVWVRGTSPSFVEGVSTSINGVLILTFALLAYRWARARSFDVHRNWAMRLYLVSNAQWFLRVGLFSYFIVSTALGARVSMDSPVLRFWTFGCYLVPLAVLEVYIRTRDGAGAAGRLAMAGALVSLTVLMAAGIFGFAMFSQTIIDGAPINLRR